MNLYKDEQSRMEHQKEYYAFISYKREDEKWAKWLQHKLEHYHLPTNVRRDNPSLPQSIRPVFKDTSELAAGVLADEIREALDKSKYLIVICSPLASQSKWVGKEVQTFIDMGRTDKIIPFIISGKPFSNNSEEECFPSALLDLPKEQELLGVNINEMGRDAAAVKVVARMFDLKFDTLWQRFTREKQQRQIVGISALIVSMLVVFGVSAWILYQNNELKKKDWNILENKAKLISEKALGDGDTYIARMLALEILPSDTESPEKPYTEEAEALLRSATAEDNVILRGHLGLVMSASFSSDGKQVASASLDGTVRMWNVEDGRELKTFSRKEDVYYEAFFSGNGKFLNALTEDSILVVWNIENGANVKIEKLSRGADVSNVCYSPDGKLMAKGENGNGAITLINKLNEEEIGKLEGHSDVVSSVEFSPDGNTLLSSSYDGTVRLWNLRPELMSVPISESRIQSISVNSEHKLISVSSADGIVKVFHLPDFEEIFSMETDDNMVKAVLSPDGKRIAICYWEMSLWDLETGEEIANYGKDKIIAGCSVAYSPDGKFIAFTSISDDGNVELFDANSLKPIWSTPSSSTFTRSICFSPDGSKIAVATTDGGDTSKGSVLVYEAKTGKLLSKLYDHSFYADEILFCMDGERVMTVTEDNRLTVCNPDGKVDRVIKDEKYKISSARLSRDGKYMTTPFYEGGIAVWDFLTGIKLCEYKSPLSSCSGSGAFYYFNNDLYIIAGYNDGCLRIWDFPSLESLMKKNSNKFKNRSLSADERKRYYME